MREREYKATCWTCHNRWYLRLRDVADPTLIVICPRCQRNGIANELPSAPKASDDARPSH